MKCSKCGAENKAFSKFCHECGAELKSEEFLCPSCGKKVTPGDKFCPNCGNRLTWPEEGFDSVPVRAKPKKEKVKLTLDDKTNSIIKWSIFALSIFAIVLMLVGMFGDVSHTTLLGMTRSTKQFSYYFGDFVTDYNQYTSNELIGDESVALISIIASMASYFLLLLSILVVGILFPLFSLRRFKNDKSASTKPLLVLLGVSAFYVGSVLINTLSFNTNAISSGNLYDYSVFELGWGSELIIASNIILLISIFAHKVYKRIKEEGFNIKRLFGPFLSFLSVLLAVIGIFASGLAIKSNYVPSLGVYDDAITKSSFAYNAFDITRWTVNYALNGVGIFAGYAFALSGLALFCGSLMVNKKNTAKTISSVALQSIGFAFYLVGAILQCKNMSKLEFVNYYSLNSSGKFVKAIFSSSTIIFIILTALSIISLIASVVVEKRYKVEEQA